MKKMNISDNSGTKALIANATVEVAINNPEKFPSVREICEKAHIDRSTFYYHFRSIDQLFDYHNICSFSRQPQGFRDYFPLMA